MAKRMWTYLLPCQGSAFFRGDGSVLRQEALNCIAAELSAPDTGKKRIVGAAVAFAQPGIQHCCRFWTERRASMFSAFPLAVNMRAGSQHDVPAVQAGQLGDPESRLNGKEKHCSVATPDPGGRVDRRQKGVDLFAIEKFDGPPLV